MISDISIIFMISEYSFLSFVALKIIKLSYLNRREQRLALNNPGYKPSVEVNWLISAPYPLIPPILSYSDKY